MVLSLLASILHSSFFLQVLPSVVHDNYPPIHTFDHFPIV